MGNQIAIVASAPVPLAEMRALADSVAKSGLFGMKNADQALALMAIAQAEGRHPALAARDYDIIQGRAAKKTEAMMRDFLESGGKVEWHALTDTQCEATFSHPAGGTAKISWDMERAKQAQLGGKDNWKKYPRQMLRSRVVSEGVRTVCPMATSGMYVPEEIADIVDAKVIEPTLVPLPGMNSPTPAPTSPTSPPPPPPPTPTSELSPPSPPPPPSPSSTPATTPTQEHVDPETGEITERPTPRSLGVVERAGKANWSLFGTEFIAALLASQTREEGEAWIKENRRLINACKKEHEKVHQRISHAVEVMRQRLPEEVTI